MALRRRAQTAPPEILARRVSVPRRRDAGAERALQRLHEQAAALS